jgi:hypothetical protein
MNRFVSILFFSLLATLPATAELRRVDLSIFGMD